jgi:cytochrome b6-f complex iron-sulfur subunit
MKRDKEYSNKNAIIKRRDFLGRIAIGSMTGVGIIGLLGSLDVPIPRVSQSNLRFKVGRVVDFPLDAFTYIEEKNIYVYRERRSIKAVSAICTHLGCVVRKTEYGFTCPCHGSYYDRSGKVLAGPAPRGLDWLKVEMSPEGKLIINASQRVKADESLQV